MTARLKTGHTLYSIERKLATSPSDPVLDFSPLFPSFFLLFPDDKELADLLFAFSYKEYFARLAVRWILELLPHALIQDLPKQHRKLKG